MLDAPDPEKAERIRRATIAALSNPSSSTHPIPQPTPIESEIDPSLADMDALTNHVHGQSLPTTTTEGEIVEEDDDLPPVEAYGLQIKYAALYNRWRKVMPPLKVVKAEELANGVIVPPRVSRRSKVPEEGEEGVVKKTRKRKTTEDGGEGSKARPKRNKGKGKATEVENQQEDIDPTLGMGDMGDSNDNYNFDYDMAGDTTLGRTLASETIDQVDQVDHHEDMLRAAAVGDDVGGDIPMEEEEPDEPIEMVEIRDNGMIMEDDEEEEEEPEEMIENRDDRLIMDLPAPGEGLRGSAEIGDADGEGEGEEIDDPRLTEELHLLASEITSTWRH